MKMKTKRLSCVLAFLMTLSLSSCGASDSNMAAADTAAGGSVPLADAADGASERAEIFEGGEYFAEADKSAASADAAGGFGAEGFDGGVSEEKIVAESEEVYTDISIYERPEYSQAQAGLLTSGEWSDNKNFDFWKDLISSRQEWNRTADLWELNTLNRIAVTVTDGNEPVSNVTVKLLSDETVLWKSVSDNNGNAYLFDDFGGNNQYTPTKIIAEQNGTKLAEVEYSQGESVEIKLTPERKAVNSLDLMFVVDTTGSMGDELYYLQTELSDIVKRVASENQIPVRVSVNFYRDTTDKYVVRSFEFTENAEEAVMYINQQDANGGGDYEEAVEEALSDAVYNHSWESSTRLMFLVLDAPPHYSAKNAEKLSSVLSDASAQGIRIIPVASSGVDTETEFLCRTFSLATGGTYTFLTNHSGIGGSHLEPTIGHYQVEKLNDMIVRIIGEYIR